MIRESMYVVRGKPTSYYVGCDEYGYEYDDMLYEIMENIHQQSSEREQIFTVEHIKENVEMLNELRIDYRILYLKIADGEKEVASKSWEAKDNYSFLGYDVAWDEYDFYSSIYHDVVSKMGTMCEREYILNKNGLYDSLEEASIHKEKRFAICEKAEPYSLEGGIFYTIEIWIWNGSEYSVTFEE